MSQLKVNSIVPVGGLPSGANGGIIQVISAEKTDTFSTSSNSFVDVTGLSVSITPKSSSNKVLVMIDIKFGTAQNGAEIFLQCRRGSTLVYAGANPGNRQECFFGAEDTEDQFRMDQASANFLDSPSTTSATTYKVQMRNNNTGHTLYINRTGQDVNGSAYPRTASSIIAMEVKA